MKSAPRSLVASLMILFALAPLEARIIHVPDEDSTIRAGIDDAADGDTVMVSPGSYLEHDLDFQGKAITVMSEDPQDPNTVLSTIIDANSLGRLFYFHSGEDSAAVLSGFTLTGGHTTYWGGAVWCQNSSPRITFNIVRDNASDYGGAGIFVEESGPIIRDNTIIGNSAQWGGGGIRCSSADPLISRNTIVGNTSDYGGGIDCHYASDPIIVQNTILGNTAGDGGGVYCYDYSSPLLIGNVIGGNSAEYGGGMHCRYDTSPLLVNDTFVGNRATIQGGAVRCRYSAPLDAVNSIFWADDAPVGKEFFMGGFPSANPSKLTISYSDVEGGISSVYTEKGNDVDWGPGMIDLDPLFVSMADHDYRLLWGSPCIDAGEPDSVDLDGTRREIGARFYDQDQFLTLYLTPDTTVVDRGGRLGVTYTLINRWNDPVEFTLETVVTLPNGIPYALLGPSTYLLPDGNTVQVLLFHDIPAFAPLGAYIYHTTVAPADSTPAEDRFVFEVRD